MLTIYKFTLVAITSSILMGCGGGGGGGGGSDTSSESSSSNVVSIPATSSNSLSTSGHNTKDLNFNTNIVVDSNTGNVTGISLVYNYNNSSLGLLVDNTDEIQIIADGQTVSTTLGSQVFSGDHYSYNLPDNVSVYEFRYTRGGVVVGEASLSSLPLAFDAVGTNNGDTIDVVLTREANHTYKYAVESLMCSADAGQTFNSVSSNYYLEDDEGVLTGDYSRSLSDAFNQTSANLQTSYDNCYVDILFYARLQNMNLSESSANIDVFAASQNATRITLF
ncbi:hypothetical protein [Enterovibrio norvegicus]|uniref:hypothetical protein n=1 Tax=Enterovibrio norvegicus TaxID=188144 RepID=UPI000C853FF7|nr:hypothetical protein [Enterovibrio norvegicus]PMH64958.1 hypothetical protein BCU62_00955 [Enterovibrio norvegicus]